MFTIYLITIIVCIFSLYKLLQCLLFIYETEERTRLKQSETEEENETEQSELTEALGSMGITHSGESIALRSLPADALGVASFGFKPVHVDAEAIQVRSTEPGRHDFPKRYDANADANANLMHQPHAGHQLIQFG